jgi:RimJ/RimL family protein N-acetyltransferase
MALTQQSEPSATRVIAAASLRDDAITLSPVLPEDIGALFTWLNDAKAALSDMPYRPIDCVSYKVWLDKQLQEATQILFIIRALDDPRAIGFLQLKNFHAVYQSVELSIRIGAEKDRGKGHGSRAVRLALDYAWTTLNMHRVTLNVFSGNARAIAAYRRAGFREEGVLRHAAYVDGQWLDVAVMGAVRPGTAAQP